MYDFKGKSDWQGGTLTLQTTDTLITAYSSAKFSLFFFNENQKQDGTVTVSLSITATNDSHKQK